MPRPGAVSPPVRARVAPEYSPQPSPAPGTRDEAFAERARPRTRDEVLAARSRAGDAPARRTVTITGRGSEGYASRRGTSQSMAQRHRQLPRHERAGFRPDRAAMWAVLLGVILMLAAVTSSHAATLAAHALR
jgi:hypothetical protein